MDERRATIHFVEQPRARQRTRPHVLEQFGQRDDHGRRDNSRAAQPDLGAAPADVLRAAPSWSGSRLVGHRLDPALLVGAILLFQPPGCLDYVLDLSATKLITL